MRIGFFVFVGVALFFSGFFTGKFIMAKKKIKLYLENSADASRVNWFGKNSL